MQAIEKVDQFHRPMSVIAASEDPAATDFKSGQQVERAVADILVLVQRDMTECQGPAGILPLADVDARLFVKAQQRPVLRRMSVPPANRSTFRRKFRVGGCQPVVPAPGLQFHLTPDANHCAVRQTVSVRQLTQAGRHIATGADQHAASIAWHRLLRTRRLMLRQGQQHHLLPLLWGKKRAVGPSGASLPNSPECLRGDAQGSVDARRSLFRDGSPSAAPSHRASRPHGPITESGRVPLAGLHSSRCRRSRASPVSLCCPAGQYTCAVSCGSTPRTYFGPMPRGDYSRISYETRY